MTKTAVCEENIKSLKVLKVLRAKKNEMSRIQAPKMWIIGDENVKNALTKVKFEKLQFKLIGRTKF